MRRRTYITYYLLAAALIGAVAGALTGFTGAPHWLMYVFIGLYGAAAPHLQQRLVKPRQPQDRWLQQ